MNFVFCTGGTSYYLGAVFKTPCKTELAVRQEPARGDGDETGAIGPYERTRSLAYLKDVLTPLPTHRVSQVEELLPR